MTRPGHPIHRILLDALGSPTDGTLLDLGCGDGETLATAISRRFVGIGVVGIDTNLTQLTHAAARLAERLPQSLLLQGNLEVALPLRDESVDWIVSHNVLEYLVDPSHLLKEAERVLRRGGRAVWSHVDFAGILLNATDTDLNRRILETHATFMPRWMNHTDGYLGRRLPGMVNRSPLRLEEVRLHMTTSRTFDGDALWRVNQILEVLRPAADRAEVELSSAEVERWHADLMERDRTGDFYFAEPTIVVTSQKHSR